jgi:hypothetical protein
MIFQLKPILVDMINNIEAEEVEVESIGAVEETIEGTEETKEVADEASNPQIQEEVINNLILNHQMIVIN